MSNAPRNATLTNTYRILGQVDVSGVVVREFRDVFRFGGTQASTGGVDGGLAVTGAKASSATILH